MAKRVNKKREEESEKPEDKKDRSHLFQKGNQFWKLRSKHGRDKLFASPELLWESACEYFQWCDDNPLLEMKAFNTSKEGIKDHPVAKMRAYTMQGLCLFLDCNVDYFNQFEKGLNEDIDGFSGVIKRIREVVYNQKFQGAAADLLNANIIARDLGLANKNELTGAGGKDLIPETPKEVEEQLKDVQEQIKKLKEGNRLNGGQ